MKRTIKGISLVAWALFLPAILYVSNVSSAEVMNGLLLAYICFPAFLFSEELVLVSYKFGLKNVNLDTASDRTTPQRRRIDTTPARIRTKV